MVKWLLILSITFVLSTIMMFNGAYIAIFNETADYYQTSVSNIVMFSNLFNIFYLLVGIIIFPIIKKYYSLVVQVAVIGVAIGCVGRYLGADNYQSALCSSFIVAIAHMPIVNAPFALVDLFEPSQKRYAFYIPFYLPMMGVNFCIIYGIIFITKQTQKEEISKKIHNLNLIIAIFGTISSLITYFLFHRLKKQIKSINEDVVQVKQTRPINEQIKTQLRKDKKHFNIVVVSWGVILGLNMVYGDGTGLTRQQISLIGLVDNLCSIIFINVGTWISEKYKIPNPPIIFYLTSLGFVGCLLLQATSISFYPIFKELEVMIMSIICLRAGFSAFIGVAINELSNYGPQFLVSSIFYFVANAANLFGNYMVDMLSSGNSLAIMSTIIFICMVLVYYTNMKSYQSPSEPASNLEGQSEKQKQLEQQQMQILSKNQVRDVKQ